ncbi:hypothetical protein ACT3SP_14990 [Brachybacterium sp. AOP43-C2-M15]|uniref:hypothetical protein n=1 Tax=Brachybacterium sp. AOP43-C2-M15 TaxID=3457661 RepID=UPI0040335262
MTEPESTPRHGRRARALSPEESAALEARAAQETTGEQAAVPGVRGAVAPPSGDAPVPTLRKFGRRARIIELSDEPASTDASSTDPARTEPSGSDPASDADSGTTAEAGTAAGRAGGPADGTSAEDGSAATVTRDHDGVELGELAITDAPDPRPAPRFDGKVLHRPESGGGRTLVWLVWALIAVAIVVLVVLLLTGVLGSDTASAALADPGLSDLLPTHPVPEEPAA